MSPDPIRNASFDYARLLAVIGIIWFHTGAPQGDIGYSGLSFFLILLVFLALPQITQMRTPRHRAPAFVRYAAARGRRLILPWLGASVLFGALKLADVARGAPWAAEFDTTMWLTGTAQHLWFLPFAFVVCLMLWPLGRCMGRMKRSVQLHLCMTFMCLSLTALAMWQLANWPSPIAEWAYALPAVFLGVALALTQGRVWRMIGVAALFFCMALSANWTLGLVQLGVATAVLILCSLIQTKTTAISAFAARSSFGLYLIHPAVAAVVTRSQIIPDHSTTFAIIVTLGSLAIVALWETIKSTAPRPKRLMPQAMQ
jgi:peptidoglycan/LPS O-acetylase OafA/YrhL